MKITDIDDAVFSKLTTYFPTMKIYGDEIRKSFVRPCFYVETIPVMNTMNLYSDKKVLMVKIQYFSKNETNKENYDMTDQLTKVFRSYLPVLDRKLHIIDTRTITHDMVLSFTFDLDFYDAFIDENQIEYELMQDLIIRKVDE